MARPLALVTGASSGIGTEIARCLAPDHDLVLSGRNVAALDALAGTLSAARCTVIGADLGAPDGVERLVGEVARRGLEVEVLINNAGLGVNGPLAENDPRQLRDLTEVNVVALTMLCRAFLPGMLARKRGRVLNIASTAAFQPGPTMAAYYASKAYVLSLSEALIEEMAGTGVSVTCMCPGPVATPFADRAGTAGTALFKSGLMPVATAAETARLAVAAMHAGKGVVVPGFGNRVTAALSPFTPRFVSNRLVRYLQAEHGPTR